MWSFIMFIIIMTYILSVTTAENIIEANNRERLKRIEIISKSFVLDYPEIFKAHSYYMKNNDKVLSQISDDLNDIFGDWSNIDFISFSMDYDIISYYSAMAFNIWLSKLGYASTKSYSLLFALGSPELEFQIKRTLEIIEMNLIARGRKHELFFVPSVDVLTKKEESFCSGHMMWDYALPEYNWKLPLRIRKWWRDEWC